MMRPPAGPPVLFSGTAHAVGVRVNGHVLRRHADESPVDDFPRRQEPIQRSFGELRQSEALDHATQVAAQLIRPPGFGDCPMVLRPRVSTNETRIDYMISIWRFDLADEGG